MKYLKGNVNYAATIVEIKNIIDLENCDNIKSTTVYGNNVIVSKDIAIGDKGVFFPLECKINGEFLKYNNLYRDKLLNVDNTRSGFFELNGRVRAVKLRGNKSEGFYLPISSFNNLPYFPVQDFIVDESFDYIDAFKLCEKYVIPTANHQRNNIKQGKKAKISKIVPDQFRFHIDTELIKRNIDKINPNDVISVTAKYQGISGISSNIL